jgi:hypothetical protein
VLSMSCVAVQLHTGMHHWYVGLPMLTEAHPSSLELHRTWSTQAPWL